MAARPDLVPGEHDHRSPVISSPLRRLAQGAALLAIVAGSFGASALSKNVDVSVDGKVSSVHVFGSTVADALSADHLSLGVHDVVLPSPSSPLHDGDTVTVRYGRPLTLTIDGRTAEYWTTATTVDAALAQLGFRQPGAVLSSSRSAPLGRQGLDLTMTTPKQVTVVADGAKHTVTSTQTDVAALLHTAGYHLGRLDRVRPGLSTAVVAGSTIVVQRVVEKTVTATVSLPYTTTRRSDSSMYTGQSKTLTAGKAGSERVTTRRVYVDGKVTSSRVLARTVLSTPVNAVVAVGTRPRPAPSTSSTPAAGNTSGAGINLANAAMWDRIAQCESGGNWHINTGNGYYGGLQFAASTWLSNGGADFAARADLASREQQITVANRLYAKAGLSPWGCAGAA